VTLAGRVEAIHVAARNKELPHAVERARLVAGKGIEGDRFSSPTAPLRATL